ncbi:hypothetical protein ACLOJK_001312 [Asimina triloba]
MAGGSGTPDNQTNTTFSARAHGGPCRLRVAIGFVQVGDDRRPGACFNFQKLTKIKCDANGGPHKCRREWRSPKSFKNHNQRIRNEMKTMLAKMIEGAGERGPTGHIAGWISLFYGTSGRVEQMRKLAVESMGREIDGSSPALQMHSGISYRSSHVGREFDHGTCGAVASLSLSFYLSRTNNKLGCGGGGSRKRSYVCAQYV